MMKKSALFATSLLLLTQAYSADLKTFTFTADEWPEGDPPKEVFVVDGTIKVAAKDGNKAIMVSPENLWMPALNSLSPQRASPLSKPRSSLASKAVAIHALVWRCMA